MIKNYINIKLLKMYIYIYYIQDEFNEEYLIDV